MVRCSKEKWSKMVTLWCPRDGTRNRGRQVRRWEGEIKITLEQFWMRVAVDREQWRKSEEAYTARHTEIRDL